MSRSTWPDADAAEKRASTANSSAGPKCFPQTLFIKPFLMPPVLLA
jgi:hypothetical protein